VERRGIDRTPYGLREQVPLMRRLSPIVAFALVALNAAAFDSSSRWATECSGTATSVVTGSTAGIGLAAATELSAAAARC
jgi:hypothetical protein